jgi:hypothetical protein
MLVFCFINIQSLDCESSVTIILKNMNGGFYQGQTVKLTLKSRGEVLEMISDEKGEVTFTLPCNTIYNLTISNYTETVEIKSPEHARSRSVRTLSYPPDMIAKEKVFAMNLVEQGLVDQTASELPDTFTALCQPQKIKNIFRQPALPYKIFMANH